MDTEEKKMDTENKTDELENQDGHEKEMNEVEEQVPDDEDINIDEKEKEESEIKESAENIEDEINEIESDEKEEKEEVERKLTKEELEEIINKSAERDDFFDKLQRTRAEYLNFQKRKNKEIGEIRRFAIQDLAIAITSVLDNFTRAVQFTNESKDFDKLLEGIRLVEDQLYKTLEEYGVKSIETVGKPFDPGIHDAVIEEEDDNHPHHTVTMELQRGFLLHDRVIRPAKVKVSKKKEERDDEEGEIDDVKKDEGEEDEG